MNATAPTNAVARIEPRQAVVADLRKMEKQFALALPEHVSPEKFVRVVMTAINSNPDLQRADKESVLSAAMKCAQDGLLPDGREAALVVYGGKAAYLPMIAGILTKVRRSGELKTISAHVVYENDAFTYTLGDDERIEHQPALGAPRGKPIAVYAVAKTKDEGVYREVMSVEQVNQVRNVSRAKNAGPWVQWWDEMARKTVLRRLAKRLPMSTDLQQVFQRDDDHYDLTRQAQGSATLRRLHADFDEPAADILPPPEVVAEIEDEQEIIESELPGHADEPEDNSFSGDAPAVGLASDSFDAASWAIDFNQEVHKLESVDAIRAAWADAKTKGYVLKLKAHSPAKLKALTDSMDARVAEIEGAA